jgi:hypothetical protein
MGDIMARCEFNDKCRFLNKKVLAMPLTTRSLVENFCQGDFKKCTIYNIAVTHGIDTIPKYVYPDDQYELSNRVIELVKQGKLGC